MEKLTPDNLAKRSRPLRPTLADVASYCGLAKSTVSMAISLPADRCPIGEETRKRVLAAAQELGYRPNWRARALAERKSRCIGLLYADRMPPLSGVSESMVNAIATTLLEHEHHLLLLPLVGDSARWQEMLSDERLDGCIVSGPIPPNLMDVLEETQMRAVLANLTADLPLSQVLADDLGGARAVTRHLVELGHRDIVYLINPAFSQRKYHYSIADRHQGYEEVMRQAGLGGHIRTVEGDAKSFLSDLAGRPDHRPTAVICYSHRDAIDLTFLGPKAGVSIPRDLSVAAFNDVFPMDRLNPSITTIRTPADEMGRTAATLLMDEIHAPQPPKPRKIVLEAQLMIRESTAKPMVG